MVGCGFGLDFLLNSDILHRVVVDYKMRTALCCFQVPPSRSFRYHHRSLLAECIPITVTFRPLSTFYPFLPNSVLDFSVEWGRERGFGISFDLMIPFSKIAENLVFWDKEGMGSFIIVPVLIPIQLVGCMIVSIFSTSKKFPLNFDWHY